ESCHVSPINQPIKYHFSATSPISFPKRLVSISIVFSSFLVIQKLSKLKSTREYSTAGDQICSFNITDVTQDRQNPTSSWKASSLGLSASSDRGSIYSHDPSRQNWSYSLIHPIVSHKGEVDRHEKGFAGPERIQKLVKKYYQFVLFPIYIKKKTKKVIEKYWKWELTNETQPIWLQNSKEVTTMEYNEFYRITFKKYLNPLASPHFTTE
ncbi:unnamed protein product, partial [Brassica oleracea var. botrytis]